VDLNYVKLQRPPAVIHNPLLRARRRGRIAIECSCQPGQVIGVQKGDLWDGQKVLDVQRTHEAAVAHRDATAREREARAIELEPVTA
jgi:hypothetical protein